MLGHSSIITTADTYTSVLPDIAHQAAQATADMITTAAQNIVTYQPRRNPVPHTSPAITEGGYGQSSKPGQHQGIRARVRRPPHH
jgi:hypothetical protein